MHSRRNTARGGEVFPTGRGRELPKGGGMHPGRSAWGVCQTWGVCLGGLQLECLQLEDLPNRSASRGVCLWGLHLGDLPRGSASRKEVCPGGSAQLRVCIGGVCPIPQICLWWGWADPSLCGQKK